MDCARRTEGIRFCEAHFDAAFPHRGGWPGLK
eukprot:SAG11_NODE_25751_length_354_cov_1.337255_1_plen_31_part_10